MEPVVWMLCGMGVGAGITVVGRKLDRVLWELVGEIVVAGAMLGGFLSAVWPFHGGA